MSNNNVVTSTGTTSTQPVNQTASTLGAFVPILLMVVFFYFLIFRPQQKREAKRRALINSAEKGDRIVTASGIIGTIHKIVSDEEVSLEIAEGVRIRILKNSIANILDKKSNLGKNTDEDEKDKKGRKKPAKSEVLSESADIISSDSIIKTEK